MEGVKTLDSIDSMESIESSQPTEKMKNGETVDQSSPYENTLVRALNQRAVGSTPTRPTKPYFVRADRLPIRASGYTHPVNLFE